MTEQQLNDVWTYDQSEQMESAVIKDSEGFYVGYVRGIGLNPAASTEELSIRITADHNLNLLAMNNGTGFHIGQRVKKVTGEYHITGEVRSIFTKADGVVRLVVEHQAEGGGSFLHVYGPNNLEALDEGGEPK